MNSHSLLIGIAATLLAVSATSAQQAPAVTQRQKAASMHAFTQCMATAAHKLDAVHRSDTEAVALAMQSRCAAAYHRHIEVYSRDMTPEARARFMQGAEENFRTFVPVVIEKLREGYGGTKSR